MQTSISLGGEGKDDANSGWVMYSPTLTGMMHVNCSRMCLHSPSSYYLYEQELHATFRIYLRRKKVESTKWHDSPTDELFVESSNSRSL